MTLSTVFAVALATAVTPVAASAVEMASAARSIVASIENTSQAVSAIAQGAADAQARVGFPAVATETIEPTDGSRFHAIIARYAGAYGVPVALAHAVIRVESNYRPKVRGRAGEVGLMQIKPATARGMGFRGSIAALYEPETNIRYGMQYLGEAHRLGGGAVCRTILKYNAGHGARRMNPVSRAYCGKVQGLLAD